MILAFVLVSATVAPLMVQELQDPSKVHLSWTAPPIQELRGRLLEYRVEIKEKTDDGDVFRPLIIVPLTSADYEVDGESLWSFPYRNRFQSNR